MKIYTQRISQTLAEQISQTYYGNVVTSKVKEDIIICRTYSAETLEKATEEVPEGVEVIETNIESLKEIIGNYYNGN